MKPIDIMLNEKIIEGIKAFKKPIEIIGAAHPRTDGWVCNYIPKTKEEYAKLPELDTATLIKYGCQLFSYEKTSAGCPFLPEELTKNGGLFLWLYPVEWYEHIPTGTKVVTIHFDQRVFKIGESSNHERFGALAFGFLKNKEETVQYLKESIKAEVVNYFKS